MKIQVGESICECESHRSSIFMKLKPNSEMVVDFVPHRVVFVDALTETFFFFFLPLEVCYCNSQIPSFSKQLTGWSFPASNVYIDLFEIWVWF